MSTRLLSGRGLTPPARPAVIGSVTGSPTITPIVLRGVVGTLYDFATTSVLTVERAGRARAVTIGAASQDNGPSYGNCGLVFDGWIDLPAGPIAVTVGAFGASGSDGGPSSIGSIAAAAGGLRAVWSGNSTGAGRGLPGASITDGQPSDITGTLVTYGQWSLSTYGSKNGAPTANNGRVFLFVPA